MKSTKIAGFLCFIILPFMGGSVLAQGKEMDKKTKQALEYRYKDDKYYAETKGPAYRNDVVLTSWVGAKLSDLYKSWGAPTKSFADETGGQVIVYDAVTNFSGGSYTPGYTITTTRDQVAADGRVLQRLNEDVQNVAAKDTRYSYQRVETTTVYVNKDGVITKVDSKTNRY